MSVELVDVDVQLRHLTAERDQPALYLRDALVDPCTEELFGESVVEEHEAAAELLRDALPEDARGGADEGEPRHRIREGVLICLLEGVRLRGRGADDVEERPEQLVRLRAALRVDDTKSSLR